MYEFWTRISVIGFCAALTAVLAACSPKHADAPRHMDECLAQLKKVARTSPKEQAHFHMLLRSCLIKNGASDSEISGVTVIK